MDQGICLLYYPRLCDLVPAVHAHGVEILSNWYLQTPTV